MTAGRIFGISLDELQQILNQEQSRQNEQVTESAQAELHNKENFDVPTYIRNLQHSK